MWALSVAGLAMTMVPTLHATTRAGVDDVLQRVVTQEIQPFLPTDGAGGAAVAVLIEGRTVFFNYGWADLTEKRRITSDSLFNLGSIRKVFEATLLAQAFQRGEMAFDDPVAKYVTELQDGNDIRRVTIGQLAAHTSGLLLPQDHPPWPTEHYTLPEFIRALNNWKADKEQEPGKQHIYTHAGYVLLQLAIERRFDAPIGELIDRRVTRPLGLVSTTLPLRGADGRAEFAPGLISRAVQGYGEDGESVGPPGDQQSYYDFPGTGQMFSSARDLATFVAASLGELTIDSALQEAMQFTHRGVFQMSPRNMQAMAWEVNNDGRTLIVDKPGGLNNSSTYIGFVPSKKLGVVILLNRGNQKPYEFGRRFLFELSRRQSG